MMIVQRLTSQVIMLCFYRQSIYLNIRIFWPLDLQLQSVTNLLFLLKMKDFLSSKIFYIMMMQSTTLTAFLKLILLIGWHFLQYYDSFVWTADHHSTRSCDGVQMGNLKAFPGNHQVLFQLQQITGPGSANILCWVNSRSSQSWSTIGYIHAMMMMMTKTEAFIQLNHNTFSNYFVD